MKDPPKVSVEDQIKCCPRTLKPSPVETLQFFTDDEMAQIRTDSYILYQEFLSDPDALFEDD